LLSSVLLEEAVVLARAGLWIVIKKAVNVSKAVNRVELVIAYYFFVTEEDLVLPLKGLLAVTRVYHVGSYV